jgi:tetratricopeptide (TPR) repeat protein
LFYKNNDFIIASNLYKRIIHINKYYIDAYIKLAEIYYMKFDDEKKKEAIEILKSSLEFTTDEKEKESIEQFISVYENQIENNIINVDDNSQEMLNMNLMEHSNIESN